MKHCLLEPKVDCLCQQTGNVHFNSTSKPTISGSRLVILCPTIQYLKGDYFCHADLSCFVHFKKYLKIDTLSVDLPCYMYVYFNSNLKLTVSVSRLVMLCPTLQYLKVDYFCQQTCPIMSISKSTSKLTVSVSRLTILHVCLFQL